MEVELNGLVLSDDRLRVSVDLVHKFLRTSYWCPGIPRRIVERSINNSLCFGVYDNGTQVAFARVVTDYATSGYLADVFVLESYRRRGTATWMVRNILDHPQLKELRRWFLLTRDAHEIYARVGFHGIASPETWMEKVIRNAYQQTDVIGSTESETA